MMLKNIVAILFLSASLFAQPTLLWQKTLGGTNDDSGYSIKQTNDGGYVIVGSYYIAGPEGKNVYLVKTDSFGDTLWTKQFGGINNDEGFSVEQTMDNGFIITGYTRSFGVAGSEDVYLIKTDLLGNVVWTKTFGNTKVERGVSVKQTNDGSYIIVGQTYSFGAGQSDIYFIKTDMNGDTLWTRTYGGVNNDLGFSVQQTADNGYIITGPTSSYGLGGYDIYLVKTDSLGNVVWTKTFGGAFDEVGNSIIQTNSGYLLVGATYSFGEGEADVYLIKMDFNGDTVWTKTYGGINYDEGYSITQTMDSSFIIAGLTTSFGMGNTDAYFLKIDANGDTLWTKTVGGINNEECYSICLTTDGCYVATGFTTSLGLGGRDLFYFKIIDGITPVEFISFSAATKKGFVLLTWQTATEINNLGFEIQKKSSGSDWKAIGFVNGSGTTTEKQNYSFEDTKNYNSTQNYRLKQIDFDGSFNYSEEISVFELTQSEYILEDNYPNPFNPSTTIKYSIKDDGKVALKIFNIIGEEVQTLVDEYKLAGSYQVDFNARTLSSGIYIYKIQSGEFQSSKKMLLIK